MTRALRIFHTDRPTGRGMVGTPLTTDHEHMTFLAMRRERKEQEKRNATA